MAWVPVPGSNGAWEYDDAATAADTYSDANGTTAVGVRTYLPPNGGNPQMIYIKARLTGDSDFQGEISKNYYDARIV